MSWLLEGIKFGLVLTILVGPLFFALVQAGVEQGFRAGAAVGLGIWISDLLFIVAVYLGLSYISQIIEAENFPLYLGIGGSITLIVFGLGTLSAKPPLIDAPGISPPQATSYLSYMIKGFLINTINPFTVFFWVGLMSTIIIERDLSQQQAFLFFGGILGTIVVTDSLKVLFAKKIRNKLRPIHVLWLRRISGSALIIFGLILVARVLANPPAL